VIGLEAFVTGGARDPPLCEKIKDTQWSNMEHLGGAKIADLIDFAGNVDPVRGPLGFL